MNAILVFLIVVIVVIFLIFIFIFMPRKCPKCHKHSVYESHSDFIGKKTEMRTVTTQRQVKDKKGNLIKETHSEQKPYEYSEYSVLFVCGTCNHSFYRTIRSKGKTYSNYSEFKKSKKLGYVIGSTIFVIIFGILLGCLIGNIVKENNKSNQEKMQEFLIENGGSNGTSYTCYDELSNTLVKGELSFQEGGFELNNSSYDYRFKITNYPVSGLQCISIEAAVFFSLNPETSNNYGGTSLIQYSASSTMACVYSEISGDDYFDLTYKSSIFLPSNGWETKYDVCEKEWQFYSWHAIKFSFLMLEDICESAGFDIYQIY